MKSEMKNTGLEDIVFHRISPLSITFSQKHIKSGTRVLTHFQIILNTLSEDPSPNNTYYSIEMELFSISAGHRYDGSYFAPGEYMNPDGQPIVVYATEHLSSAESRLIEISKEFRQ